MSSIMEALKRMEAEEKSQDPMALSPTFSKPRRAMFPIWMVALVFVAGVSMAGGAVVVYHLVQNREPVQEVAAQKPLEKKALRVVAKPEAPPVSRRVVAAGVPLPEVGPEPGADSVESLSIVEPKNEAVVEAGLVHESPQPEVAELIKPPENPLKSLPKADTSQFTLQGIRWSETPQRRIAVINNQILRQGGAVDGAKVVSILQNGVVLESSKGRVALPFKR